MISLQSLSSKYYVYTEGASYLAWVIGRWVGGFRRLSSEPRQSPVSPGPTQTPTDPGKALRGDPRPLEGFLGGLLGWSKEERPQGWGRGGPHEPNQYSSLIFSLRLQRRGNYERKVLRLLGEQASWTSFLSHM